MNGNNMAVSNIDDIDIGRSYSTYNGNGDDDGQFDSGENINRSSDLRGSSKVEKILLKKTQSSWEMKTNKYFVLKVKEERYILYFLVFLNALFHPEILVFVLLVLFCIKYYKLLVGLMQRNDDEDSSSSSSQSLTSSKRRKSSSASQKKALQGQKLLTSKDSFREFIKQELTSSRLPINALFDDSGRARTQSDVNHVLAAGTDKTASLFNEQNQMDDGIGQAIVIDLGSGVVKAGFATDPSPKVTFPTVVGKPKYKHQGLKDAYVGERAEQNRFFLAFKYPIERGIVQNWDDLDKVWHHTFVNELRIEPMEHPVLITEPPLNPKLNRELMTKMLFDTHQIQAVFICIPAILTLFVSGGRTSGLILDSGDGVSHVIAVYDGYIIPHAMARIDIAGRDATDYLMRLLISERGYGALFGDADRSIFKSLKENFGYVAVDFEAEMNKPPNEIEIKHALPDGNVITIGSERFRCAEVLFDPSLIDSEVAGIPVIMHQSVMKSDIFVRKQLLANIVISGGSTMFEGFATRLAKELKKFAPRSDVKIIEPKKRKHSAWSGGSLLTQMPGFKRMWVRREEFIVYGPQIIHTRCGIGAFSGNGEEKSGTSSSTTGNMSAEEMEELDSFGGELPDLVIQTKTNNIRRPSAMRRRSEYRADSLLTDPFVTQSNIASDGTLLKRPVVIDTGTYSCKVGFSDDFGPRGVFLSMTLHTTPELLGREREEGTSGEEILVGEEAVLPIVDAFDRQDEDLGMQLFAGVKFPIDRGIVRDFDDLERVWHCAFHNYMRVNPADHPVVLSEAPFNPKSNRERIVDIMFNKFGVPQVYICARELLSLYAADSVTGVVYQCGHTVSHVVPVFDGYVISHAMFRIDIAGRDIEDYWIKMLKERYPRCEVTRNREGVREMKETYGFIALDPESEMAKIDVMEIKNYELDDGSGISVREECFLGQEILFDPEKIDRDPSFAAHKAIHNAIMKCDIYVRKELYGNIVLCGGSSLFENFEERLTREITKLVPQHLKIRVTTPNDRKFSAWMGGCIVGSLATLVSLSVTKAEYDEAEKKKQGGGSLLVAQKLC